MSVINMNIKEAAMLCQVWGFRGPKPQLVRKMASTDERINISEACAAVDKFVELGYIEHTIRRDFRLSSHGEMAVEQIQAWGRFFTKAVDSQPRI